MWKAKLHTTNETIATGDSYLECSENAMKTGLWDFKPGTVSPYYITTMD